MILQFTPGNHQYTSLKKEDERDWISVTTFISHFKEEFDAKHQSERSSRNPKSKWYRMDPAAIRAAWKSEATRATDLGSWYHLQRETDLCELETIERAGVTVPIVKPIDLNGMRISPEQRIGDGIYPEHLMYLKSAGLCGQSDLVEVIRGVVNITDYKTNKEIKTTGYVGWDGISKKMKPPLSHLDDCHLNHYSLQLSLYMFMILKHNPKLRPGKLTIQHIHFKEAGKDKYGNPISALDWQQNPILTEIVPYELPYMKSEAITLIHWLEDHRGELKKCV